MRFILPIIFLVLSASNLLAVPFTALLSQGGSEEVDEQPPLLSDVYAWFDNRVADISTSSGLVDSWTDRKQGFVATGTTTTRPTLKTSNVPLPYIECTDDYLTLPGGFTLDRRNSAMFVVTRSTDSDINPFIHVGTTSTTHAIYQQAKELRYFGTGQNLSGEFFGDGFDACYVNVSASAAVLELTPHASDSFGASTAGTVSGGYIGAWNNATNTATKTDIVSILCYNRTLTSGEVTDVLAFLARKYPVVPRGSAKVRIYEGDSLTFGTTVSPSTGLEKDDSFPMRIRDLETTKVKFVNVAAGGKKVVDNLTATSVTTQLGYNQEFATRVVVFGLGTNDIASDNKSEAQMEGYIDTWIAAVRAYDPGAIIVGCTITVRQQSGPQELVRVAVNDHIMNTADFDFVSDPASDPRLDDYTDTSVYNTDQLHFTRLGYQYKAEIIKATLEANGL